LRGNGDVVICLKIGWVQLMFNHQVASRKKVMISGLFFQKENNQADDLMKIVSFFPMHRSVAPIFVFIILL
jgi:hypothetical protein